MSDSGVCVCVCFGIWPEAESAPCACPSTTVCDKKLEETESVFGARFRKGEKLLCVCLPRYRSFPLQGIGNGLWFVVPRFSQLLYRYTAVMKYWNGKIFWTGNIYFLMVCPL